MTEQLREAFYQTFRTTDARTKVSYDDMLLMLDQSGITDEMATDFLSKFDEWAKETQAKTAAKMKELDGKSEEEKMLAFVTFQEELMKTRPALPAQNVEVFQRSFLETVKSAADLQLLNTL